MKSIKKTIFDFIALIGAIVSIIAGVQMFMRYTSVKPPKPPSIPSTGTSIHPVKPQGKDIIVPLIVKPPQNSQYNYKNYNRPYKQKNTVLSPEKYYRSGLKQLNENHYNLAADLIKKAAYKNYSPAESELAFLYYQGLGLPHSLSKAFTWYLKAAEGGNQNAEETVGGMYLKGIGVKKNKKMACFWFAKYGNPCKNIKSGNGSSFGINNIFEGIGGVGKILLKK